MKHIFIVNPCAGKEDSTTAVTQKVEAYALDHPDFDYQIYVTRAQAMQPLGPADGATTIPDMRHASTPVAATVL